MVSLYRIIDQVWAWIAQRTFVRFEFDMPSAALKTQPEKESIYFSLAAGGLVEWLILSSWCRREGYGPILVTNRLGLLFLGKPFLALAILFRKRSWVSAFLGADTAGPRLIFCRKDERRKLFEPTGVESLFSNILRDRSRAVSVVPVLITWRKYLRGAARNPSEFLFGLSSSPNLIGKVWYLIRKRKDSTVKGLAPFLLAESVPSHGEDLLGEDEPLHIAKAARRKILVSLNEEMRVMLGPRYVSPTAVKETLLHDPEIQEVLEWVALEEGIEKKKLMLRAYRILTEIVANYSYRFIEVLYVALTWIFTRVFDGLDSKEEELERLRETLKQKPIVFVSAHRSHLDYLVIPYMLFLKDIVTPHIAAGINLAFWPIGGFLRRGGAFFIRRSFRGDRLYTLLLKKYIGFLIRNRFNIMFFIEGTRSRTGKLLPPTYGILKMVLESFRAHVCDDIALVPVSISYDEVFEQNVYARERAGAQKEKEDARALLRSRRIIRRNIGKVYVRLGDPLSAKDVFRDAAASSLDEKRMLQKTAFDLCTRINKSTPITPKSLLATIILGQSSPITLEQIVTIGQKLHEHAMILGNQLIASDIHISRRAVETLLRQFHRGGVVRSVEGALPMAFEISRERRASLIFYRNNAIHCYVVPGLAVLSLELVKRQDSAACYDDLVHTAVLLRNIFKFDFFFSPTREFVKELSVSLNHLAETDWETQTASHVLQTIEHKQGGKAGVAVYRVLLGDLIEGYLSVANALRLDPTLRLEKKGFLQKIVKEGQQRLAEDKIIYPESVSIQNYSNALALFENLEMIAIVQDKDKTWIEKLAWNEKLAETLGVLERALAVVEI